MTKRRDVLQSFDEFDDVHRKVHAPEEKGRKKQMLEKYIHDWQSFDEWDGAPVDTFLRFDKRGKS